MTDFIDPIIIISIAGAAVVSFLWLRDTRIYFRTGNSGYKKAMYQGVLCSALSWLGAAMCGLRDPGTYTFMYIGIGLILLAMYFQARVQKDNIWIGNESAWKRFIGSAPITRGKNK
ncbi:MAG TPA: ABC transporter permease [Methanocorpusculum sp.]|nr:ABC transporter permease [Methanocorpusculum sp.]